MSTHINMRDPGSGSKSLINVCVATLECLHEHTMLCAVRHVPELHIRQTNHLQQRYKLKLSIQSFFDHRILNSGFAKSGGGTCYFLFEKCDLGPECIPRLISFRGGVDTSRTLAHETIRRDFGSSLFKVAVGFAVRVEELFSGFDV